MDNQLQEKIQARFGWQDAVFMPVNSGLINHTFRVKVGNDQFLFQEINTQVFKDPVAIDDNLRLLNNYLQLYAPDYLFTAPVKNLEGSSLLKLEEHYYRVFKWVEGSLTLDVVQTTEQAFEAAQQFGKFTAILQDFDVSTLQITLPDFHNLSLRFHQFEKALQNGMPERIKESAEEISFLRSKSGIVKKYENFHKHSETNQRVTHHDTKISNILFNNQQKGICVIDLDTVMPGFYISDVGDMIRTYVCPVSEEEKDLSKIIIRKPFLQAIENGYLHQMEPFLSNWEKDHFYFSGEVLIYMQALRFLSDYLLNDQYYGSKYPGQNLVRTKNQNRLLALLQEAIG